MNRDRIISVLANVTLSTLVGAGAGMVTYKTLEPPTPVSECVTMPADWPIPYGSDYRNGGWYLSDGTLFAVAASEDTRMCLVPRMAP